jgi:DNA modification methylase
MSNYKIYVGDCKDKLKEIDSESIDCVITSPDYWQQRGDTEILPGEIGLEASYTEYVDKVASLFNTEIHRVLKPTGIVFIVISDTYNTKKKGNTNGIRTSKGSGTVTQKKGMQEFGTSGVDKQLQPGIMQGSLLWIPFFIFSKMTLSGKWAARNLCIWYKLNGQPNTSPSRFGIGDYEFIPMFSKIPTGYNFNSPKVPMRGSPGEFKFVRQVWPVPPQRGSKEKHYSQFPLVVADRCIQAGCPEEGGTVLDPFAGSGSAGVAALLSGRNFIGIEIVPKFAKIAQSKLDRISSDEHERSELFQELQQSRRKLHALETGFSQRVEEEEDGGSTRENGEEKTGSSGTNLTLDDFSM